MHNAYFDTLRTLSQPIRATDLPQTLDPMHQLLNTLGNPQKQFRTAVVAGSTGKGTTCLRVAELLSIAGVKVGLYTSPHLHLFRERFALLEPLQPEIAPLQPTRLITQSEFVDLAQIVFAAQQTLDHRYSTFESATAIALLWFAQQHVEVAVLEIGIGGRFDAVNAVTNSLAIFTPIEAEHVAMLGGSLESVAWHKAGIIQPNSKAFTVPQVPEVMAVLKREAREKHASLRIDSDVMVAASILSQRHSRVSFSLAGRIRLPGRREETNVSDHRVIIDGGHTPAAARYLSFLLDDSRATRLIIGMLRDKNVADYLRVFDAPNIHFVYTQAPSNRALSPDQLLERYAPTQASVSLVPDLDEAFAQVNTAQESLCIVAGSLRMAAAAREAYGLLSADALEEARLTRAIFEGDEYQKKLKNR